MFVIVYIIFPQNIVCFSMYYLYTVSHCCVYGLHVIDAQLRRFMQDGEKAAKGEEKTSLISGWFCKVFLYLSSQAVI